MPVSLSKERPVIARFQRQLRLAEPLVFEQMLSVNSVSVLIYMILTDPDFVPDSGPMGLLAMYGPRLAWEWLVGIGAVLKPLGLAICLLKGGSAAGLLLRIMGLTISGFWWFSLAVSLAISGEPGSGVGVVPALTLALAALWIMFRSLEIPCRHG